jgi:3-methylcrotonyl-CoA carboxylase alpha subunit
LDSALEAGDRVTPFYDPMICKLIAHAPDRSTAIERLAEACADAWIWPLKTNAPFLWRALDHPAFRCGDLDTGFIARHWDELIPPTQPTDDMLKQGAVAMIMAGAFPDSSYLWDNSFAQEQEFAAQDVWRGALGFRLNATSAQQVALVAEGRSYVIDLPHGWERVSIDGQRHENGFIVFDDGDAVLFTPIAGSGGAAGAITEDGGLISPMPGRVIAVDVRQEDAVKKGQKLVTLEAMKMEHSLTAPFDGIVAELIAAEGAQVTEGTLLVRIEKAGADD